MEFFSNSKPDLVGPKVRKSVYKIMKTNVENVTISDKISSMLSNFYKNYISENILIFSLLVLSIIFLLYRYYSKEKNSKKEKEKTEENFSPEEQKIINEIMNDQTNHLQLDTQPSFNQLESVNEQHEDINYTPDPITINIPDKGFVNTKSIYDYPQQYQNLNNPNYDYTGVYNHPSRSYYSGTYNTYQNPKNTSIINPYGWSNDFNGTTGNFVGQMTGANTQNVIDYQTVIDNMESNLINGLKVGPEYLNDIPEIEPPYADNI